MNSKLNLTLNPDAEAPLYGQIYRQVRDIILSGELLPGTQLPASRQLAQEYGLARITVTQAYDQLSAEGYVDRRRGAGTFVSEALPLRPLLSGAREGPPAAPPALTAWGRALLHQRENRRTRPHPARIDVDFTFGRPLPHIFPYDVWRRLLARYLSTDDTILSRYGSAAGFMPLREALADYLHQQRGVQCDPDQVVVVSGTQQALDILARLLLNAGDEVLVETPGYVDAYDLLRTHGAELSPIPVDDQGLPTHRLVTNSNARLVFTTPANQFPHGGTMPLGRRLELLHWARQSEAYVIEDDYDGELRYRGRPIASLQGLDRNGQVIYLGSFSKVLFPALRLGYVVLPRPLVAPFVAAKKLIDRGAPTLTQAAVTDFIGEGHFERHLRRLRKAYGKRRNALVKAMEKQGLNEAGCFVEEPAGLHIKYYINMAVEESQLIQRAAQAGVAVYPGSRYHLSTPPAPSIMLGYSGLDKKEIGEGVRRLAEVIRSLSHTNGYH